ncbi:Ubiquinone/menaquinone biosynthesis C-methyltransferase UbiE [bioreactor metagenome]|uniref:Ubiquinone/menaquinone biosynthesis C-methyltransferase UbiE n=1 Tax=bioreactor metagenome TaxID=1076179 RepID=A0A644V9R3_9ZZZZ|nr:class I SAM-dependent methyltransferase [Methanobrevibacter sp.]MEA4957330.1 class I SAM-dependent methyltransferase [Methanobrevibacter sp.]
MDKKLIINARKPKGKLGSEMIEKMNESHESLAKWGVSHLNIENDYNILDIGCGGGVNVNRFSEMAPNGKVYGIDYSELSVEKSKNYNRKAITEGKVEIIQGSVSELPFENETFNIVTGFETVYFWPDFIEDLKEVKRVLKKEGKIFICNEAVGEEHILEKMSEYIELLDMRIYSEDDFKSALTDVGFKDIKIYRKNKGNNWICAIATKK